MQAQGPEGKRSWAGLAAGVAASALLSSLIASAIGILGIDSLRGEGSNQPVVSENPLTFDVPLLSAAQEKIDQDAGRSASRPLVQPSGDVVVLDDWDYTAIVRGRPQPSKHHRPARH